MGVIKLLKPFNNRQRNHIIKSAKKILKAAEDIQRKEKKPETKRSSIQ